MTVRGWNFPAKEKEKIEKPIQKFAYSGFR